MSSEADHRPVDADSRARTHLANERTFLAWFRTGLTMIAFGVAGAQFLGGDAVPGTPLTRILATVLVLSGVALTSIGGVRYFRARDRIDMADFRPASSSVLVAASVATVTGLLAAILVWLLRP